MPPVRQGVKRELNVARVVSDYQGGATIQQVADTHHASYGTIRRLLLREKVAIRPHGGQNAISLRAAQADNGPPRPKKTKAVLARAPSTHSPRRPLPPTLLRQ
ncbi:helix-turn-helix domain-containing protein [Amycolatopsis echigonensis]|uniref:helix-turn-helix domain-containing protein n=2 Tax=Pseudonocardiaceae TaxID=2070 RepID=UPI0035E454B0